MDFSITCLWISQPLHHWAGLVSWVSNRLMDQQHLIHQAVTKSMDPPSRSIGSTAIFFHDPFCWTVGKIWLVDGQEHKLFLAVTSLHHWPGVNNREQERKGRDKARGWRIQRKIEFFYDLSKFFSGIILSFPWGFNLQDKDLREPKGREWMWERRNPKMSLKKI